MDARTAERMRLQEYKRRIEQRLSEITPRPILEMWMNDDDVSWLKSLNILVEE